jgi:hypothetical protein
MKDYNQMNLCIWKLYEGSKKREIQEINLCHKCFGREANCKSYIPEKLYMKKISEKLLEGKLH